MSDRSFRNFYSNERRCEGWIIKKKIKTKRQSNLISIVFSSSPFCDLWRIYLSQRLFFWWLIRRWSLAKCQINFSEWALSVDRYVFKENAVHNKSNGRQTVLNLLNPELSYIMTWPKFSRVIDYAKINKSKNI